MTEEVDELMLEVDRCLFVYDTWHIRNAVCYMEREMFGKLQKNALEFIKENSGWHSFSRDPTTKRVIYSLAKKGLVEINQYQMFRAI